MITQKLNEYLSYLDEDDINRVLTLYIKQNIHRIPDMSLSEIAKECYVSKGKVSSFCKKLGYESFSDLRDDCRNHTIAREAAIHLQEENLEKSYLEHLDLSLHSLKENLKAVDLYPIERFIKDLDQADCVYLYGNAYSHLLCSYIQYELDMLNKNVMILNDHFNINHPISDQSIILIITVDGNIYKDSPRLIRKLKHYSCKKWCLSTSHIPKQLSSLFTGEMYIPAENTEMKDRRILIRYTVDILIGRYQHLYFSHQDG